MSWTDPCTQNINVRIFKIKLKNIYMFIVKMHKCLWNYYEKIFPSRFNGLYDVTWRKVSLKWKLLIGNFLIEPIVLASGFRYSRIKWGLRNKVDSVQTLTSGFAEETCK